MDGQNIIELGFNIEELTAEKKQVLDLFVDMFGQLTKYDGTKFDVFTGGLTDLKKSIQASGAAMSEYTDTVSKYNTAITQTSEKQSQSKKSTDDLSLSVGQYGKILDQAAQLQAKLSASSSTAAENRAIDSQQLKARNAELQNSAKYLTAESNSVAEARAQNALLTAERDNQNAATEEGKTKIQSLNSAIDANNKFIQENSDKLAKQKINIGNYTGATNQVKESLDKINQSLQQSKTQGDSTSESYQSLVLEQEILSQLLTKTSNGFATSAAELRAYKSALDAIAIAGLGDTEVFQNLNVTYEKMVQRVNELHANQRILTSETPAIQALTTAASGLGGAYAIGAGASALFADGNEKVEKELNKLIAIMTLLQGLEQAEKAIKQAGGIATALQAVATKALNGVKAIEVNLFGASTVAVATETVAKEANVEVTEASAVAQETSAAATTELAGAMEVDAAATVEATAATEGFATVLAATGIGAILLAVGAAIVYIISKIPDWIQGTRLSIKEQEKLIDVLKETNSDLINQAALIQILDGSSKKYYENQIALSQAAGLNQEKEFALKKAAAQEEKDLAQSQVDLLGATNAKTSEYAATLQDLNEKKSKAAEIDADAIKAKRELPVDNDPTGATVKKFGEFDDQQKAAEKNIEFYQKQIDAIKPLYDAQQKARADLFAATQKIGQLDLEETKFTEDEKRKIVLESTKLEAAYIEAQNQIILNDDRSTLQQRISALRSNFAERKSVIEADKNNVLNDPGASSADKLIAEKDAAEQEKQLFIETQEDIRKLKFDYFQRDLEAETTISKNQLQAQSDIQQAITKDLQQELETRLGALKSDITDRTDIIETDYNKQIELAKKTGKTQTEIDAIESNRQKELVALTADTQKQIYDIVTSYGDKKLKDLQDENKTDSGATKVSNKYDQDLSDLDKSLNNQTVSYDHYLTAKRLLDQKYAIDKAAAEVQDDETEIARTKKLLDDNLIQIDAANALLTKAQESGDDQELKNAQANADGLIENRKKLNGELESEDKKYAGDKKSLDDATTSETIRRNEILKERLKQLAEESYTLAKNLVDQEYENKIKKTEDATAIADAATAQEIENVNASSLTNREKQEEDIILTAQQKARDTQAKLEEQQEKVKEAKFDQKLALAQIAWNTAKAVMKDTAGIPWPASLGIAATDIALGAIQGALVLAKGVPSYGEGVEDHPGGLALVGELYKPEKISIPGRESFIVDKPMYIDMPAHSSVIPLSDGDFFDMASQGFSRGMSIVNSFDRNESAVESAIENQTAAIRLQTKVLKKAFQKTQRKTDGNKIVVMNEYGLPLDYVYTKILGKR